jgi:hypothetical protein
MKGCMEGGSGKKNSGIKKKTQINYFEDSFDAQIVECWVTKK